jgi:hypothetical protein
MSSQVTFARIQEAVALEAGWDPTVANWSTERSNMFETIKREAMDQVIENPPTLPGERAGYKWSFLTPFASLELSIPYATGTVGIASGVVTLTSGTWPTWAAQGDLWIEDNDEMRRYSVNTRDSNTQITLDDTSVAVTAGETYSLKRHSYNLPSDFGGMLSDDFTFRRDSLYPGRTVKHVGSHDLRRIDREFVDGGPPSVYSLDPIAPTASAGTTWKVTFAPVADNIYFLEYQYYVVSGDLVTAGTYAYGGSLLSEAILASVRAATASRLFMPQAEQRYNEFVRKLKAAIDDDRRKKPIDYGAGRYGLNCNYHERHRYSSIDDATILV